MAMFWCSGTTSVDMNVEARDPRSAALRFEEFNGFRPNTIDGRKVRCYCGACKIPIFEGDFRHFDEDEYVTPEMIHVGRFLCLTCLTGHERGGGG